MPRFVKSKNNVRLDLERELIRLQTITAQGLALRLKWVPVAESRLEGEVRGNVIWIYSQSREKAIATLRHEFLDWLVVQSLRPYELLMNLHRVVLNAILKHLQEQGYTEKENLVEILMGLLDTNRLTEKERSA